MSQQHMTQGERMRAGLWYDANNDEALIALREQAAELVYDFNQLRPGDHADRRALLERLLGHVGQDVEILAPLQVDYGSNVSIGDHTFVNHGAYLMDGAPITIGSHCFIGPNLGCYTAQHPLVARQRDQGYERALPISVGDDCWIGADVRILPGVSIGAGCVVGAGSLVTRDIPAGYVAMGSPCRTVRPVAEADLIDSAELG